MTAVWQQCDGQRTLAEIAIASALTPDQVQLALAQLAAVGLLDDPLDPIPNTPIRSRRRFLKQVAVAGAAIPAIVSFTAPVAADTASCYSNDVGCTADQYCCSGFRGQGSGGGAVSTSQGYSGWVPPGGTCLTDRACCTNNCLLSIQRFQALTDAWYD
jgi:hypothetical protein